MDKQRATARANDLLKVIIENQPSLIEKPGINSLGGSAAGAFITALRASLIAMFEADEEG